jgi:nucleoside-diphosphate kinase
MANRLEQTLVLIKPDAFASGKVSRILERFEQKGFVMVHCHLWKQVPQQLIEEHYEEYRGLSHFEANTKFMMSGPVMSIVYLAKDAIISGRQVQGKRETPGTVRGDFCNDIRENLVHASDSENTAKREIDLWTKWHETHG